MARRELALLSPYRPPTAYAVSLSEAESAAWLNAWAALWQPAAIREAAQPPTAGSPYDHNDPVPEALYVLPASPSLHLDDDWLARCRAVNALAVPISANRDEAITAVHAALGAVPAAAEIRRWFQAIGFGYLLLEVLFDAAHHAPLLNRASFWQHVQQAVAAADGATPAEVRPHLCAAAQELQAAREGLTPNGIGCIQVISRNESNLGEPWPVPFTPERPWVLVTASGNLERLAQEHPERFAELHSACGNSPAVIAACGVAVERHDSLLPPESQLWSLLHARTSVKRLLGVEMQLFGRANAQFHPQSPSWLRQAGYDAAIIHNPAGASLPFGAAAVTHWPGPDGLAVNTFTLDWLPAHEVQTFFNLGHYLHDALQRDSVPAICLNCTLAPTEPCRDWLTLLELAPVFGECLNPLAWIRDHPAAAYLPLPGADDYSCHSLEQIERLRPAVNPISSLARHARLRRRLDAASSIAALILSLERADQNVSDWIAQLPDLERRVELGESIDDLPQCEQTLAAALARIILARAEPQLPGWLVLNPTGAARRVALELQSPQPINFTGYARACEYQSGICRAVVDVPAFGFAWLPREQPGGSTRAKFSLADGTTVRNEFLEAELDPATGGVKALRDRRMGITRLGQMLVWQPGSRMIADTCTITHSGPVLGEATSRGVLRSETGNVLARFQQRVRAWIGRPVIEFNIRLEPVEPPAGYPWHAYFACRFAWRDERAALFRGLHGLTYRSEAHRPACTDFLEIRLGKERNFIFTGGMPFIQKHSARSADILLIPPGELATEFDLLIAFDREHPALTAMNWIAPALVVEVDRGPPASGPSGWLANINLPSLLATRLWPAHESQSDHARSIHARSIHARAIHARLLETAGFPGSAAMQFARTPARGAIVDLNERWQRTVPIDEHGLCHFDFSANSLINLRFEWD